MVLHPAYSTPHQLTPSLSHTPNYIIILPANQIPLQIFPQQTRRRRSTNFNTTPPFFNTAATAAAAAVITKPCQAMRSLLNNIQKRNPIPSPPMNDDLPISQSNPPITTTHLIGLRRRIISSFSVKIQPFSSSAASSWAALRRSKSAPDFAGDSPRGTIRRFWDWSWGWLISKKPAGFARDLEMNEEDAALIGARRSGTLRQLLHRIRSEIKKIVPSQGLLPTTMNGRFRYDSFSYAQNFDEGNARA